LHGKHENRNDGQKNQNLPGIAKQRLLFLVALKAVFAVCGADIDFFT
jgi:hypothetical protein